MLDRIVHPNGLVTYRSALLPVRHAFSTRLGGVSRGGYASLNLGAFRKDDADHNTSISENFRRLRAAVGLRRFMRYELKQVHSHAVWCDLPDKPPHPDAHVPADALVTDRAGLMLTIRTADCVPVLLHDGRRIAAVHAGWRGVVAGVIAATLAHLDRDRTCAAIGPAISAAHFEVGPEVVAAFVSAGLACRVLHDRPTPHIDLSGAVADQLIRGGVAPDRIDRTDRCTYRDELEFFSYRRDVTHRAAVTGHMAAVIGLD